MFKTTLVGNTGGHVNYKKVKNRNGEDMDRLSFTLFVREKGKEKKTPVFCVWTRRDLSEIAKYLMIENTKEDAKAPYCSRLLAIDGRLNIKTDFEEVPMYDKVKTDKVDENGDTVYEFEKAIDDEDKPYVFYTKVTSVCVFIDNLELLDKSPGKVSESTSRVSGSRADILNKYRVKKDDVKVDPLEDIVDTESDNTEETKEVKESKSKKKSKKDKDKDKSKKETKKQSKKEDDDSKIQRKTVDDEDDIDDEDILNELQGAM